MTRVSVVYSPAQRQLRHWLVELPAPASAAQALESCGLLAEFPELDAALLTFGIWGRKVPPAQPLRDGDRLEVYRALQVDPKVARRERFRRQGAKSAGLFASKRAGAKAGY